MAKVIEDSNKIENIKCDQSRVIENAIRDILRAIGENPDRTGLLLTPSRVARMYK